MQITDVIGFFIEKIKFALSGKHFLLSKYLTMLAAFPSAKIKKIIKESTPIDDAVEKP